ncbi:[protein ADP-ribosylglutamate] hydrolase [Thermococcus sp.]|uniref:[protein ADP-ribosylglutamate] hydrolase n=1 Tax=Thermococcus sp. TaxID=35749 RepID=UPI00338FD834
MRKAPFSPFVAVLPGVFIISKVISKIRRDKALVEFGNLTFNIVRGNVINFSSEAVVNSVDKYLSYKRGVSKHIAKAAVGNVEKYKKLSKDILRKQVGRDFIRVGEVIVTPPFRLERNGVRYVINVCGPNCRGQWNEKLKRQLKLAIISALKKGEELGVKRIAFPAIRAGAAGCPFRRVVETFIESVEEFSKNAKTIEEVFLVLRTKEDWKQALEVLDEWKSKSKIVSKPSKVPRGHLQGKGFPVELLERYEPLEFLGEGGFAKVFKVRRKEDGRIVAIKIPRVDEKTSSLFLKEIAAWYHLNHPNIVRLYKTDILPIPYLEMEYVEGVNVNRKVVRDLDAYPKPLDEKTALRIIYGIAKGLEHAHSKGICHLDLKPLNVLLKGDLTPKITDWGLAKISTRSSLSTNSGYSPLYAAPEQLDEKSYGISDHRTDLYQLGVIFYELLTGRLSYRGNSTVAVISKILAKEIKPLPPSKINPALVKYDGVLEKLLAKNKENRFQSVKEFLNALNSLEKLHAEREELKNSLRETKETLRRSRSKEEIKRLKKEALKKTTKIVLLSAKLNDKAELLNALEDLRFYTKEHLTELQNVSSQIEFMIKEGIPISDEFVERLKILLHRIEQDVSR